MSFALKRSKFEHHFAESPAPNLTLVTDDVSEDEAPAQREHFEHFGDWMAVARSKFRWDAPHFRLMQAALDRVTKGELLRVLFQVPIRHGKTEHNTIGYGCYRLEQTPERSRIILATYNQDRAGWLSAETRKLAIARGVELAGRDKVLEWQTAAGGGVKALGGGGSAGYNADLIIIDDAIGSRAEAESQRERDRVWDWITNDVIGRSEPHTAVLFSMSRWHQDDPAGRLREQQGDRWFTIDLPAEAEPNDPLGRVEGEPLWPEERGAEWLDSKRVEVGTYGFASLLQGRPRPREGGMFRYDWWKDLGDVPAIGPMVRYWDLAGTEPKGKKHDPDFSVGALLCRMHDLRTAIVDIERFRKGIAERDARLLEVAADDLRRYRSRVRWWIETEAGIAGEERTADLVRKLQNLGLVVNTEHPTGNKIFRAEPLASKAGAGNVVLCPGEWREPFKLEAADFPNGKHDDQVDAVAGADSKLDVPVGTWSTTSYKVSAKKR